MTVLTESALPRSVRRQAENVSSGLNRARASFAICLLLAGYFAYTAVLGAIHSHQLSEEQSAARRDLAELGDRRAYLEAVRAYVSTDAYVEQEARRELGYVREGEVPFVVISPSLEEDAEPTGTWWERLFPR